MSKQFNFYTEDCQFTIGSNFLVKNGGEVIGEGDIFVFQLLLGYPAWIIVNPANEFILPQIIKTDKVISVLPDYEFFDGVQRPEKFMYCVSFFEGEKQKKITVNAVDEAHVQEFVKANYQDSTNLTIKRSEERISC